jgi:hypothetical protein
MSGLDDREKAFENKFQHDQDLLFKINSRRARLLGLWAAERLGITGDQAEAYALQLVAADLEEAGHVTVIRRLQADFKAKGVELSDHRIGKEIERLWQVAHDQVA